MSVLTPLRFSGLCIQIAFTIANTISNHHMHHACMPLCSKQKTVHAMAAVKIHS